MTSDRDQPTVRGNARRGASPRVRLALWLGWLAVASFLAWHHVMWRDEARALHLALLGDSAAEMVRAARGYGHPLLWHLLLRGTASMLPAGAALPVLSFAVGAAMAALLAFRSPFGAPVLALALFGGLLGHEYVVMARNYGLSGLLMFAICSLYPRWRDRPGAIGLLLFLLCNANVHSVVMAGAFLIFWYFDLRADRGASRASFAVAVASVTLGTLACAWQVYPPIDDAAALPRFDGGPLALAAHATLPMGPMFHDLLPGWLQGDTAVAIGLPVLLLLSVSSLRRSPGAMLAAAAVLVGFLELFVFVYPGSYRHQGLFVLFLLAMAWLAAEGRGGRWDVGRFADDRVGRFALAALLALQLGGTSAALVRVAGGVPDSRSRDVAELLARPGLRQAVVLSDPDWAAEAISYYAPNRFFLARERRFGTVPAFSSAAARQVVTLPRLLLTARRLHAATGRPVVIVLNERLTPGMAPGRWSRGYFGPLLIRSGDAEAFLGATRRLARLGPALTDESYDVYQLRVAGDRAGRV